MHQGKFVFLSAFILALLILTWGCSGGGGGGVVLPETAQSTMETLSGTSLWGLYQVTIDPQTEQVDIVKQRGADLILNVIGFLEPPALVNMTIDFNTLVFADPLIEVDVILKHPIMSTESVFQGFDVRGIVIGPELTNADGYTIVMNPGDFDGVPFGYVDGLLGAPYSYGQYDGLWGYKYFCDDLGLTDDLATFFSDPLNLANRGVFREGSQNTRHYSLSWANTVDPIVFLVFNYAIYANYNWPLGMPDPTFDIDDFQLTSANSREAFCAEFAEVNNTLYWVDPATYGGTISFDAEIWDWQGLDTSEVVLEGSVAPDSDEAGGTAYSWLYHFVDYDPGDGLTTNVGLDLMVTVTDEYTFGESWFFDLLDPAHPLYAEKLYNCFKWTATVGDEAPAAGLTLKDSGDIPATLPTSNEKNFCVVGDNTFGKVGVYYHAGTTGNYMVHKYPLDYSTTSTLFCTMVNPWGPMDSWFGSPAEMGSIEVVPMGAFIVNTRSTGADPFWGGPRKRCHHLYGTTCNAVNVWLVYDMQTVDLFSTSDSQGIVYSWAKGDPSTPAPGYTYKHDPPYEGGSDWLPGYYPNGSGDGYVGEDHTRGGMDGNPNITGWDCMVAYVEGTTAATSAVEVFKNFQTIPSPSSAWTLKSANGLIGRAKDVSWLKNYGEVGFEDAVGNYMCVLEDNEDGTWQVSCWEWDNTASDLLLVARYDPPISGTPYNLDCDTTNNEIHVWADDAGTVKYYIFYFG